MYLLSTSALLLSLKVPIFSVLIHTLRTGAYLQNTAQFDRDPDFIGNSAGGSATPAAPAAQGLVPQVAYRLSVDQRRPHLKFSPDPSAGSGVVEVTYIHTHTFTFIYG